MSAKKFKFADPIENFSQAHFAEFVKILLRKFPDVLIEKNKQYGASSMETGLIGNLSKMTDKYKRYVKQVENIYNGEDSSFEGLTDTLFDIIGYAVIGLYIGQNKGFTDVEGFFEKNIPVRKTSDIQLKMEQPTGFAEDSDQVIYKKGKAPTQSRLLIDNSFDLSGISLENVLERVIFVSAELLQKYPGKLSVSNEYEKYDGGLYYRLADKSSVRKLFELIKRPSPIDEPATHGYTPEVDGE